MKKSCKYCGRVHDVGFVCDKKPKRLKARTDEAGFRSRWAWTKKARAIKERDHFLCLVCLAKGVVSSSYLEVHHIVPLSENADLGLDDDNLITLCEKCHKLADDGKIDRDYLRGMIGHTPLGGGLKNLTNVKTTQPRTHTENP